MWDLLQYFLGIHFISFSYEGVTFIFNSFIYEIIFSIKVNFRYLFLNFDLFMIALLSSLFIKGALLPRIVFDFVHPYFSKTLEKTSVNFG